MDEKMDDEFCLKMPDFHVTFRDLLHAVNLRHGTDGFTSPPKEGVLKIFFSPWENQRLRSVLNPRTWVPKASTLPLDHRSRFFQMPLYDYTWYTSYFPHIHARRYSPFYTLASLKKRLHSSLSSARLHPLIPRIRNASLWTFFQIVIGFPTDPTLTPSSKGIPFNAFRLYCRLVGGNMLQLLSKWFMYLYKSHHVACIVWLTL